MLVLWTGCGGISIAVTGVETKLKEERKGEFGPHLIFRNMSTTQVLAMIWYECNFSNLVHMLNIITHYNNLVPIASFLLVRGRGT